MAISKTEQKMRESVAQKGWWLGIGKRCFDIMKRLEADGELQGLRASYCCYNVNGVEFKSQWNSPRIKLGYEVSIHVIESAKAAA